MLNNAIVISDREIKIKHMKMKRINAFYAIGTTGMIVTAILHILLAVIINQSSVHTTFISLYTTFTAFLAIGSGQIIKGQRTLCRQTK